MFDWENAIALHAKQGNWASFCGEGKSHGFSRVMAGTWVIFSSFGGNVHSKLEFVQRSQGTTLGKKDTSGM